MSSNMQWRPSISAVGRSFEDCLAADFLRHGPRVVAQLRMRRPEFYLRLALGRLVGDTDMTSEQALEAVMRTLSEKHMAALVEVLSRDINQDGDAAQEAASIPPPSPPIPVTDARESE